MVKEATSVGSSEGPVGAPYVPGEVLVRFRDDVPKRRLIRWPIQVVLSGIDGMISAGITYSDFPRIRR